MVRMAIMKRTQFILKLMAFAVLAALVLGSGLTGATSRALASAIILKEDNILTIEVSEGVLLKLDREAASIFVANPLVADVQVKSTRMLYVFGLTAGSTTLYAVDAQENIIYSATIEITQNIGRIQETISKLLPTSDIYIESVNGLILLTGHAISPGDADTAQRMVQQIAGEQQRILNRIEISTPNQVNLRVKMAEMSRSTLKSLGIDWLATFESGSTFLEFSTGFTALSAADGIFSGGRVGDKFDVTGVLDALEDEGYLSILAEPNLTAISGETASFLAGGEFPIPVVQSGTSDAITIIFKEFGVGLLFTPTVLSENKINLKVASEVSQLSVAGSVTLSGFNIPALTTRRANTTVELASGQSFAIAGLLQSNISQTASKFPWLGDIPILGTLFRSDEFQREETELVIIITPYIVRPVMGERLMAPTDINHLPADTGHYLKGKRDLAGSGGLKTGDQ